MKSEWLNKKTILAAAAGLVVGLLIGWLLIGWYLWPVQWVDADPWDLRMAHKEAYTAMVADSLANNGDYELAQQRLRGWDKKELSQILDRLIQDRRSRQLGLEAQHLDDLRMALALEAAPVPTTAAPTAVPPVTPTLAKKSSLAWLPVALGIIVALLLLIAGVGYLTSKRRLRRPAAPPLPPDMKPVEGYVPLRRFVATYRMGEGSYDESFSIEGADAEFLGECGMAIAESLQAPDRVTALEVWLFDKNDIRTVTKVLLSSWAFGNQEVRSGLAAKGELALAEAGQEVLLETDRLRIKATVRDVTYGAEEPAGSYFERVVVDLDAMMKAPATPA